MASSIEEVGATTDLPLKWARRHFSGANGPVGGGGYPKHGKKLPEAATAPPAVPAAPRSLHSVSDGSRQTKPSALPEAEEGERFENRWGLGRVRDAMSNPPLLWGDGAAGEIGVSSPPSTLLNGPTCCRSTPRLKRPPGKAGRGLPWSPKKSAILPIDASSRTSRPRQRHFRCGPHHFERRRQISQEAASCGRRHGGLEDWQGSGSGETLSNRRPPEQITAGQHVTSAVIPPPQARQVATATAERAKAAQQLARATADA